MPLPELWDKPYNRINLIFFGVVVLIFLYSAFFTPSGDDYPVKCIHQEILGKPCPTCGLSHSFSELVRGNFREAKKWNVNGPPVFLFFLVQLFLRIGYLILHQKNLFPVKTLVTSDVIISVSLFLVCFRRLLFFWSFYLL